MVRWFGGSLVTPMDGGHGPMAHSMIQWFKVVVGGCWCWTRSPKLPEMGKRIWQDSRAVRGVGGLGTGSWAKGGKQKVHTYFVRMDGNGSKKWK